MQSFYLHSFDLYSRFIKSDLILIIHLFLFGKSNDNNNYIRDYFGFRWEEDESNKGIFPSHIY